MKWKEITVEADGNVVCRVTKDEKGMHMDCTDDCKKLCEEFRCGCC